MSRKDTEHQRGREEGLDLALRLVREGGPKALEEEVKYRNITGIHTGLCKKEIDNLTFTIKDRMVDAFTVLSVAALYDEFGFGEKRCQRFLNKLIEGADMLNEDLATWDDYIDSIKNQIGLKLEIKWND